MNRSFEGEDLSHMFKHMLVENNKKNEVFLTLKTDLFFTDIRRKFIPQPDFRCVVKKRFVSRVSFTKFSF